HLKLKHPALLNSDQLEMSLKEVRQDASKSSVVNCSSFVKIQHPVLDCERVGSALKIDPYHGFDRLVDNFARFAKEFNLKGADSIMRMLYQIEGSLNGEIGLFEWIVEPGKGITHRFFIKNGKITGRPNIF